MTTKNHSNISEIDYLDQFIDAGDVDDEISIGYNGEEDED